VEGDGLRHRKRGLMSLMIFRRHPPAARRAPRGPPRQSASADAGPGAAQRRRLI
jgi:hypothetical protein